MHVHRPPMGVYVPIDMFKLRCLNMGTASRPSNTRYIILLFSLEGLYVPFIHSVRFCLLIMLKRLCIIRVCGSAVEVAYVRPLVLAEPGV